jgi:hypothetical protein
MQQIVRSWVQHILVGLWKLGVSNRLSCAEGMSSRKDLQIIDFVDVVKDGNNLRWGRM